MTYIDAIHGSKWRDGHLHGSERLLGTLWYMIGCSKPLAKETDFLISCQSDTCTVHVLYDMSIRTKSISSFPGLPGQGACNVVWGLGICVPEGIFVVRARIPLPPFLPPYLSFTLILSRPPSLLPFPPPPRQDMPRKHNSKASQASSSTASLVRDPLSATPPTTPPDTPPPSATPPLDAKVFDDGTNTFFW